MAYRQRKRDVVLELVLKSKKRRTKLQKALRESMRVCKETGCWLWKGGSAFGGSRYGDYVLKYQGWSKPIKVHRLAHILWIGPIPTGHQVRHRCDTPRCINPDHLLTGTAKDNSDDKVARGRQSKGEGHYRAILTEDDVAYIRRKYKPRHKKYSGRKLAEKFGVGGTTISMVVSNQLWREAA